jgi:uracil-DNA glycosylase
MHTKTHHYFNLNAAHPSWHDCIKVGLSKMDPHYLNQLYQTTQWLPGSKKIFSAFSLPINSVNTILFGESPYPRAQSANGYAFWDENVNDLWSPTGLHKTVNRATSLRNIIKMLLIAEGRLSPDHTSQSDIASINKSDLVITNQELFKNILQHGFLLLNATPVLQKNQVRQDAKAWRPFVEHILRFTIKTQPDVQLLLLGKIANTIDQYTDSPKVKKLYATHPYNLAFITHDEIIAFFKPLHLLLKTSMNII